MREPTTAVRAYPMPRKNRGPSGAALADQTTPLPRTRVFPFMMAVAANVRKSLSTPRIQGPAMIKGISLTQGFGVDPPTWSIEVGTSLAPVTENNVALASAKPYSVLTELVEPFGVLGANTGDGLLGTTLGTSTRHLEIPLDLIVDLTEFFVVVASCNVGAGAANLVGHVRVIEGVNRQSLSFFL